MNPRLTPTRAMRSMLNLILSAWLQEEVVDSPLQVFPSPACLGISLLRRAAYYHLPGGNYIGWFEFLGLTLMTCTSRVHVIRCSNLSLEMWLSALGSIVMMLSGRRCACTWSSQSRILFNDTYMPGASNWILLCVSKAANCKDKPGHSTISTQTFLGTGQWTFSRARTPKERKTAQRWIGSVQKPKALHTPPWQPYRTGWSLHVCVHWLLKLKRARMHKRSYRQLFHTNDLLRLVWQRLSHPSQVLWQQESSVDADF